jgi:hypothetical protein
MDQAVQAVPVRNKEREAALRRDINELLLKHLDGATTIAETEMIGDRIFDAIDCWNRKGVPTPP